MPVVEEVQLFGFVLSFILSFFHFVPVSLSQENFGGRCILFSSGYWIFNATTGKPPTLTVSHWGRQSLCHFNIFMGMSTMIVSFTQVVRLSCSIHRRKQPAFLPCFVDFSICLLNVVLFLITSLILSIGFQEFCSLLEKEPSPLKYCSDATNINFTFSYRDIDMAGYYNHMRFAQFGAWFSWFMWVANFILASLKLYHVYSNVSDGEPFTAALSRETEKLVETVQAVRHLT